MGVDGAVASAFDGGSHGGPPVLHEEHESIQGFPDVLLLLSGAFGGFSHSEGLTKSCDADPCTLSLDYYGHFKMDNYPKVVLW